MEKQTKILLGVGAVIAAYLILKPKKAAAQTSVAPTPAPAPVPIVDNNRLSGTCPDGYTYNSLVGCLPNKVIKAAVMPADWSAFICWDGYKTNNPSVDCIGRGGYNSGVAGSMLKNF